MRHFLLSLLAIGLLAPGMMEGTPRRSLVALAGSVQGGFPGERRAEETIEVATVATAAKVDLTATALAIE